MTRTKTPVDIIESVAMVVHEAIRGYRNAMHALFPEKSSPDFQIIEPWEKCEPEQASAARELVKFLIRSDEKILADTLDKASDMGKIGIIAAGYAFESLRITIRPGPEEDRTGMSSVQ